MATRRLSESSYIVLGMLELVPSATPYDLKQIARHSTEHFWTIPHAQLYQECDRMAKEGLLNEEREQGGRRRRVFSLTESGRQALEAWRSAPLNQHTEMRDEAILKLFFGADPSKLATSQLALYEEQLHKWESLHLVAADLAPRGVVLALEAGIGHVREYVRFWKSVCENEPKKRRRKPRARVP